MPPFSFFSNENDDYIDTNIFQLLDEFEHVSYVARDELLQLHLFQQHDGFSPHLDVSEIGVHKSNQIKI